MFYHRDMIEALDNQKYEYVFFSSERRMDKSDLIENFYSIKEGAFLDELTISSIILRCRYLSGINNKKAREYVRRMWRSAEILFTRHNFELVISAPVDNYVLDIIFRVASIHKIPAIQPRDVSFPGLARITNSCDHPILREVSREEAEIAVTNLQHNFKAYYQEVSRRNNWKLLKRMLRELLKKPLFEFWKLRHRDPLAFHYNTIFPNQNAITMTSIAQLSANRFFDLDIGQINKLKNDFERIIFWPLSMSPESAINYLNFDHRLSDYKYLIEKTVKALPDNWCLIVKEHPSAIGYRPIDQYEPLLNKNNVFRVSMDVTTSQIILLSDAILLNTGGTTGLEAVAMGKSVLSIGNCHYKFGDAVREINDFDDISDWPNFVVFGELDHNVRVEMIQNYLKNTILDATWGPNYNLFGQYNERILKTIEVCVDIVRDGYCPQYLSDTKYVNSSMKNTHGLEGNRL